MSGCLVMVFAICCESVLLLFIVEHALVNGSQEMGRCRLVSPLIATRREDRYLACHYGDKCCLISSFDLRFWIWDFLKQASTVFGCGLKILCNSSGYLPVSQVRSPPSPPLKRGGNTQSPPMQVSVRHTEIAPFGGIQRLRLVGSNLGYVSQLGIMGCAGRWDSCPTGCAGRWDSCPTGCAGRWDPCPTGYAGRRDACLTNCTYLYSMKSPIKVL